MSSGNDPEQPPKIVVTGILFILLMCKPVCFFFLIILNPNLTILLRYLLRFISDVGVRARKDGKKRRSIRSRRSDVPEGTVPCYYC